MPIGDDTLDEIYHIEYCIKELANTIAPEPTITRIAGEKDILSVCAKVLKTTPFIIHKNLLIQIKQLKETLCAYCSEKIPIQQVLERKRDIFGDTISLSNTGTKHTEIPTENTYSGGSTLNLVDYLYVFYTLDWKKEVATVYGIQLLCWKCNQLKNVKYMVETSGTALAVDTIQQSQSASSHEEFVTSNEHTLSTVDTLYQQFLKLNKLDPFTNATNFQTVISLAFSLYLQTRMVNWSLAPGESFNLNRLFLETTENS